MKIKLESFLQEVNDKTTENNQYPVLTSSKAGLFLQSDYFNKQVASKDNTGYKIIKKGQFTYRAMSDTGEFFPNMLECTDIGIVSPAYPVFEIINPVIIPEYLKYYFKSKGFQQSISAYVQGSTRTSVKFVKLKTVSMNLPSLEEQKRTIEILDITQNIIEGYKQEIDKLDDLIRARFVEMFGDPISNPKHWDIIQMNECLDSIDNGKSFVCEAGVRIGDEPAILKLSAVTYGIYRPEENKKIIDKNDFIESAEVHEGDLLFTRKNTPELVGMAAYVASTPVNLMMPDLIFRLNTNDTCNKLFLWQLINHDLFRGQIQSIASGSAKSMSNISKERLGKLSIYLPPLELQNQFAAFVTQVNKSKAVVQKSLDEMQTLFDSLMQQYFG
jgi:type I restriction enzyme S subunit